MKKLLAGLFLVFLLASARGARADYLYTFNAVNIVSSAETPYTFTLQEPSLITTTGPFAASFDFGSGATITSGFFDAGTDCFSFSKQTATDCTYVQTSDQFQLYADFPGAITIGTFPAVQDSVGCSVNIGRPCLIMTSLTITSTTPEPSSLALLGTGLLGCVGVSRRRVR